MQMDDRAEQVILVDEADKETGLAPKLQAHIEGLRHRAISVLIFNSKGVMLLQQRHAGKYHSGGLWTNACCSHPAAAASRRLQEELGFVTPLEPAFSFTYKAPFDNGLTEYEFDHVLTGQYDGHIQPDPEEVCEISFMSMDEIRSELANHPEKYTEWFRIAFPRLEEFMAARR